MDDDESFICGSCAEEHPGLPSDYAFGLPDDLYNLSFLDKYRRTRSNADLCTLDEERYFIRGVLPIPFTESEGSFGLGIWAEASKAEHDLYLDGYYDDLTDNAPFAARMANDVPGYESLNLPVDVQFRFGNDRPLFVCRPADDHLLAQEQRAGISNSRHHEILAGFGFFEAGT